MKSRAFIDTKASQYRESFILFTDVVANFGYTRAASNDRMKVNDGF
jgi:hypothetical protein